MYDCLDQTEISTAAESTESKQAPEETVMRVTRDALAVAKPIWMIGHSAYDPKDIKYRVEDRIEQHSEDIQVKQSTLDETHNRRTGIERTSESVKDSSLGRTHA
jgi:hypothetical protein